MTDDSNRSDGLADVINLLAAPIAGGIRTMEQFRRGVDEFVRAAENLNRTIENVNEAAMRANRIMSDLEAPIRAMIPQLTRTVRAADEITKLLEGPVRVAAPNIEKVAETFSSPAFTSLPTQLGEVMRLMGDVSRRLGPLTQFAESAGGLFGGFKLPGMGGPKPAAPSPGGSSASGQTATSASAEREPSHDSASRSASKPAAATSAAGSVQEVGGQEVQVEEGHDQEDGHQEIGVQEVGEQEVGGQDLRVEASHLARPDRQVSGRLTPPSGPSDERHRGDRSGQAATPNVDLDAGADVDRRGQESHRDPVSESR